MRLWHLPLVYLDNQRLQSQHFETHGLLTTILNGKKWGSISEEFRRSCHYVVDVHDRAVIELSNRGAKRPTGVHPTPILASAQIPGVNRSVPFKPTREHLTQDIQQLRAKWEVEGYYFGVGRIDLRYAEAQLDLPLGRPWSEVRELREETRTFVKANREQLRTMRGTLGEKLTKLKKDAHVPHHAQ